NHLINIVTRIITNKIDHVPGTLSRPIDVHIPFKNESMPVRSQKDLNCVKTVDSFNSDNVGRPMIRKLMEYKAIIINIPDNRGLILPFVCKTPVIHPANKPARVAN